MHPLMLFCKRHLKIEASGRHCGSNRRYGNLVICTAQKCSEIENGITGRHRLFSVLLEELIL